MDSVSNRVDSLERRSPETGGSQSVQNAPVDPSSPRRPHLKLDVPRFHGEDPHGWIFKITQFFT
ncbi:retrotransposon-derived protein PEG10-like, partial [Trifolium medium]|nr:retrotransposon-derived protein PEG10-like [Trifolium medium]